MKKQLSKQDFKMNTMPWRSDPYFQGIFTNFCTVTSKGSQRIYLGIKLHSANITERGYEDCY